MKNVVLWGLDGRYVRPVMKRLADEKAISIKKWFYNKQYKPLEFFQSRAEAEYLFDHWLSGFGLDEVCEPPESVSKTIYDHLPLILQNFARDKFFYREPVYEYVNIIHMYTKYFYALLKNSQTEMVIFDDIPHGNTCILFYYVAKAMGLDTLILTNISEKRFVYCSSIEDYGKFEGVPLPALADEEAFEKVAETYHKDLKYMDQAHIKADMKLGADKYFKAFKNPRQWAGDRKEVISYSFRKYRDTGDFVEKKSIRTIGEALGRKRFLNDVRRTIVKQVDFSLPYVYFPLHLQPEMTTDTIGGMYSDQLLAIEKLRHILPDDVYIYIKENPRQTHYMREKYFFERLKTIKNAVLVDRQVDTYELMAKAKFVATITGTAGWEAISGGKPAVIFGHTWYERFDGVFRYHDGLDAQAVMGYEIDHALLERQKNELNRRTIEGIYKDDFEEYFEHIDIEKNEGVLYASLLEAMKNIGGR